MINRMSYLFRLAIVFLIQALVIVWMVWDRSQILANGQTVRLQVQPVDPRDIFRGDYVVLDYDISSINLTRLDSQTTFAKNDIVYVGLQEKDTGYWVATSIHANLPAISGGQVYISGRVRDVSAANQQLRIKYGIESYFVPEGEGQGIEEARDDLRVEILAAIDQNGRAAIKGLIVGGVLRYEEPLF